MRRELTDMIVVHCAATPPHMDIGAKEIRDWHTDPDKEGGPWSDIGYHYVIRRDGRIEAGRPLALWGAHVRGHNDHTVGICLVGGVDEDLEPEDNFEPIQKQRLQELLWTLIRYYAKEEDGSDIFVVGHNDLDPHKNCPCFNVTTWWNAASEEEWS